MITPTLQILESYSMFSEMMVAVNVNYVVIMFALALVIVYCLMLNDVDE